MIFFGTLPMFNKIYTAKIEKPCYTVREIGSKVHFRR